VKKYKSSIKERPENPRQSPSNPPMFAVNQQDWIVDLFQFAPGQMKYISEIIITITNEVHQTIKFFSFSGVGWSFLKVYMDNWYILVQPEIGLNVWPLLLCMKINKPFSNLKPTLY